MSESIDVNAAPTYSNLVRVSTTPEEVILAFGVRSLEKWESTGLAPHTSIAISLPAAKRLAMALGRALKDYERAYGPISTEVGKKRQGP
jgi:hypothetical protein